MVYPQPRISPGEWDAQNSRGSEIQMDNLITARWPDLVIINQKRRNCRIVDFTIPAGYGVKWKEREKENKYLDFARELKKTMEYESDSDTSDTLSKSPKD